MSDAQLQKIKEDLVREQQKYCTAEELEEYFRRNGTKLDNRSMLKLFQMLVNENAFGWLDWVLKRLPDVASLDDEFMELIATIWEKIRNDFARGPFITSLIMLGEKKPEFSTELSRKWLEEKPELSQCAGILLGSAARKQPKVGYKTILKLYNSSEHAKHLASIRALRVMFDGKQPDNKEEVFNLLKAASDDNQEINVRLESLQAYIDFYTVDPLLCKQEIVNLARQAGEFRRILADRLSGQHLGEPRDTMDLLKICAEDIDVNISGFTARALIGLVEDFPDEIMKIVGNWIMSERIQLEYVSFLLERLGEVSFDKAIEVVEEWLGSDAGIRLKPRIPWIVNQLLPKNNRCILFPHIHRWIDRGEPFVSVSVDILHEVLSEMYYANRELGFINESAGILAQLAKSKGLDPDSITRGESDRILQCAELIEKFKYCTRPIDFDKVSSNLKSFPKLASLLNKNWIEKMKRENNRTHPILRMLSFEIQGIDPRQTIRDIQQCKDDKERARIVSSQPFETAYLDLLRLEENLNKLSSQRVDIKCFKRKLANEQQVEATISEIEFITPFVDSFDVQIEPIVNGKKPDARIESDGQTFYVEVISPEMFKPLRLLSRPTSLENRIGSKIYDEFKKQLSVLTALNKPAIIAIDIGRSEVDYDFVEDYLLGTLKTNLVIDKQTHRLVDSYTTRDNDSMHDLKPEMDMISAVVCFRVSLRNNFEYQIEGRVIQNPHAKFSFSESILNKIKLKFGNPF